MDTGKNFYLFFALTLCKYPCMGVQWCVGAKCHSSDPHTIHIFISPSSLLPMCCSRWARHFSELRNPWLSLCSIRYKRERAGGDGTHGCISARLGRGIYPFLCIPPARTQVLWLHLIAGEPGKCHQPCVRWGKEGSLVNKQPD